ncbi:hypothetical protein EVAR_70875_1 [Eumeta japonica]|uniref:Uncharacterized protein n=1 Tax=Eumeta variegata TaxID=151549 RepID=A0A4C2AC16_EUMVA|nr:hypothetical protein EVAR_70875_1 [Eumeta japonica]
MPLASSTSPSRCPAGTDSIDDALDYRLQFDDGDPFISTNGLLASDNPQHYSDLFLNEDYLDHFGRHTSTADRSCAHDAGARLKVRPVGRATTVVQFSSSNILVFVNSTNASKLSQRLSQHRDRQIIDVAARHGDVLTRHISTTLDE